MTAPYRQSEAPPTGPLRCLYCGLARSGPGAHCACGAEPPTAACAACGGALPELAVRCACGAPSDAWDTLAEGQLTCPRCRVPLGRTTLDVSGLHVESCAKCHGTFAYVRHFGELLEREVGGQDVGLRRFVPLPPGKELPREALLAPAPCPHCGREMDRARFAQRASLVVDVCPPHGAWFDAGELVAVVSFVKERATGDVPKGPAELEDDAKWDRIRARVEEEGRVVGQYMSSAEWHIWMQRHRNRNDL